MTPPVSTPAPAVSPILTSSTPNPTEATLPPPSSPVPLVPDEHPVPTREALERALGYADALERIVRARRTLEQVGPMESVGQMERRIALLERQAELSEELAALKRQSNR